MAITNRKVAPCIRERCVDETNRSYEFNASAGTDGNGKPVTNFSIAMNNANRKLGYALQTELPDTESIFLDCAGWERMSDRVSKVIHKGQLVGLAGLLKVENYKDNNGNDRQRLRLTVNDFQIRYSGKNNNNAQNTQPTNNSSYQEPSGKVDVTEDDLPF